MGKKGKGNTGFFKSALERDFGRFKEQHATQSAKPQPPAAQPPQNPAAPYGVRLDPNFKPKPLLQQIDNFLFTWSSEYRKGAIERHTRETGRPHPMTGEGLAFEQREQAQHQLLSVPPNIYGSARWMTAEEAHQKAARELQASSQGHTCPWLGEYLHEGHRTGAACLSAPPGHLITIAPTRSGKGAAHIIPALLTLHAPIVVVDPQGENYTVTAQARRSLGPVYRFDPFGEARGDGKRHGFNLLDSVKSYADARLLAQLLVPEESGARDNFWQREAVNLLAGALLYVKQHPSSGPRDMTEVRRVLTEELDDFLKDAAARAKDPAARRSALAFLRKAEKEQSGVLSHLNATMAIWDDPELLEAVAQSDFTFHRLRQGICTIYLILPPDKMEDDYAIVLRAIVGQAIQQLRKVERAAKPEILFILDEFPALGAMPSIVKGFAQLAKYGLRLWVFAQNIHQLKALYPRDWEGLLSEAATKAWFGTDDHGTLEYICRALGQRTISVKVPTTGASGADGRFTGSSGDTVSFHQQALRTPEELAFELGQLDRQVVFQRGLPPALVTLEPWFKNPRLNPQKGR